MTTIVHCSDRNGVTIRVDPLDLNRLIIRIEKKSSASAMSVILTKDRALHFITPLLRIWCDIDG